MMKFGNRLALGLAVAVSVALSGCDQAEKKAAEAKAATEKLAAEAKAKAEAEAAKVKEEAAAKAKEAMESGKAELTKKFTEATEAMDRKLSFLKEKAAKLKGPAKTKADEALAAFDKAKATVVGLKDQIASVTDPAALPDIGSKLTSAITDAQKALDDAETAIMKKK